MVLFLGKKDYLIKGYVVNNRRLEYLEKTVKLLDIVNSEWLTCSKLVLFHKLLKMYTHSTFFLHCKYVIISML